MKRASRHQSRRVRSAAFSFALGPVGPVSLGGLAIMSTGPHHRSRLGPSGRVAWHLTTRLCPIRTRRGNDNFAYGERGDGAEAARHLPPLGGFSFPQVPFAAQSDNIIGPKVVNSHERDYFVIVTRRLHRWSWQIHRRSKPPALRFRGGKFTTASAAENSGQKALKAFLGSLPRDQD